MGYTSTRRSYEPWWWYVSSNAPSAASGYQINNTLVYITTRTGQKVDQWKHKIQTGVNATSPYATTATRVEDRKDGVITFKWILKTQPNVIYSTTHTGFAANVTDVTHLLSVSTTVQNVALMKIIKKVKAERAQLNGLAFAGELREALHGIRHPFQLMRQQVYSHLNTLNKRKRAMNGYPEAKRKKAWRETIAGTWLETSFGLKPLIKDTEELATAIARFQFEEPNKARLQSKHSDRAVETTSTQYGNTSYRVWFDRIRRRETDAFCRYSIGTSFSHKPAGSVERLLEVLGVSLENFVPGLYEVMPWSWLIDYFSNLGQLIEAGTLSEADVKWICRTVGLKTMDTYLNAPNRFETARHLSISEQIIEYSGEHFGWARLSKATIDRTNPVTLGLPKLVTKLPGYPMQAANLVAILAQFSGKTYQPSWAHKVRPPSITRDRTLGVHDVSNFL